MTILVNGVEIGEDDMAREVQYHPAPSLEEARTAAAQALVVRELLLQEAKRLCLTTLVECGEGMEFDQEDALVQVLIEREVSVPEPEEARCREEFDRHPENYQSPDLFEAAHILFPAPPADAAARLVAKQAAVDALALLQAAPRRFAELARESSACPSAAEGGSLGQFTADQMVPEFMTFLNSIEPGSLCPVPVPTQFGYHVIRLDQRERGQLLPFERVRDQISVSLYDRDWRQAVHNFIGQLVARASIKGIDLPLTS
ncbi:MAG: peptidylprolyl isomerase [Rhodospirillaceae bacterium]